MGVFRKRISSQYWCKCFVTFLQKRTKGYKIFSRIITTFHADATNIQIWWRYVKKHAWTWLNVAWLLKNREKGRYISWKIFSGILHSGKKRPFIQPCLARKTTQVEKSSAPRVGVVLRPWGTAPLYLYSDRACGTQRTFLWEVSEIQADVFCVPHQPGR